MRRRLLWPARVGASNVFGMQEPKALQSWEMELHWESLATASARAETGGLPKSMGPKHLKKGVDLFMRNAYHYAALTASIKYKKAVKKTYLTSQKILQLEARYRALLSQIGNFESLSQGSVMPQPPRAWRWTRKVAGKTVSLGLTPGKAEKMKAAIANQRAMDQIIDEMREITQKLILESPETVPISRR